MMFLNLEKPHLAMSDFFIKQYFKNHSVKTEYKFRTLEDEKQKLEKNPELAKKLAELIKLKEQ
jgi:hypothetical protein